MSIGTHYWKRHDDGTISWERKPERCEACNGGPEHHPAGVCVYHWVYRGVDGTPFRLVRTEV